jgi:hypothetical protein
MSGTSGVHGTVTPGGRHVATMVLYRAGCVRGGWSRLGGSGALRGRCPWLSVRQGGQEPAGTDKIADSVVTADITWPRSRRSDGMWRCRQDSIVKPPSQPCQQWLLGRASQPSFRAERGRSGMGTLISYPGRGGDRAARDRRSGRLASADGGLGGSSVCSRDVVDRESGARRRETPQLPAQSRCWTTWTGWAFVDADRLTHNPEVAGSNPAPAISFRRSKPFPIKERAFCVPGTVVRRVVRTALNAAWQRDGGDGMTRDETAWTWWTLPPAIAGWVA